MLIRRFITLLGAILVSVMLAVSMANAEPKELSTDELHEIGLTYMQQPLPGCPTQLGASNWGKETIAMVVLQFSQTKNRWVPDDNTFVAVSPAKEQTASSLIVLAPGASFDGIVVGPPRRLAVMVMSVGDRSRADLLGAEFTVQNCVRQPDSL